MLTSSHAVVDEIRWPAKTSQIPKDVFHREDVYRLEIERIFGGAQWHPVAHRAEVPKPGDFKTLYVGETPVFVLHGADGRVRVFENACPHRGTQLQTCASGKLDRVECPYHRWQFDLNGVLLGAPGSERFPDDFRKEDFGLYELRSEDVHGLVCVTLDREAPSLREYLDETPEYVAKIFGDEPLRLLGYQKTRFSTNWKAYADNEGYHAPLLHRAFRLLGWHGGSGFQCVTVHGHKIIEASLRLPTTTFLDDAALLDFRDRRNPPRSVIVQLFPMVSMVRHMDVINVRFAFPRSVGETEVHYTYFAAAADDSEMVRHRVRQASNLIGPSGLISLEDGAVFNRLQRASHTSKPAEFQKGVSGPIEAPCIIEQNDEASNLVKWERYREIMGFARI